MSNARIRLGKRAMVRSSTTASPVTTSVTASSGSDRIAGIDGQAQDYPVTEFWYPGYIPAVDLEVFVAEHRADWARLDTLTRRHRQLTGEEIDELVRLYQRTATGLSALQAAGLDPALAGRLSSQLARSRAVISGAPSSGWQAVGRFAAISFPVAAYRARWWWLGCAAASVVVAVLIGWRVAGSPSLQASLLPKSAVAKLVQHDSGITTRPMTRGRLPRTSGRITRLSLRRP